MGLIVFGSFLKYLTIPEELKIWMTNTLVFWILTFPEIAVDDSRGFVRFYSRFVLRDSSWSWWGYI